MSRSTRSQYLRPQRRRKLGFQETLAMVKRQIKRKAIADGHILNPRDNPPRYEWHWQLDDDSGVVHANTRGEARSLIKRTLKRRLPTSIIIVRVDPHAHCTTTPNPLA